MKGFLAFIVLVLSVALSLKSSDDRLTLHYDELSSKVTILGQLGIPLGELATIEGIGSNVRAMTPENFLLSKVNGQALAKPISIIVSRAGKFPDKTPVIVEGYETGGYEGTPSLVEDHFKLRNERTQQINVWHFQTEFICMKLAVAPKGKDRAK